MIAKINDPVRAAAYAELGVVTLCRTNLMVDAVATYLNLPMQTGPGIDIPETPGHEHPHPSGRRRSTPPARPAERRGRPAAARLKPPADGRATIERGRRGPSPAARLSALARLSAGRRSTCSSSS